MSDALKSETNVTEIKTGVDAGARADLADAISKALADTFSLYVKTLGVHWNAVGPVFYTLHKMTQDQYEDMEDAVDAIAERIRAIGHPAPAGFADFKKMSIIDSEKTLTQAEGMIEALANDNEAIAKRLRGFVQLAEEHEDVFTADMLTARIGQHEENVWMLRALLA